MAVNQLSVEVYREIEAEGLVSRLQLQVLKVIWESTTPLTVNEIGLRVGTTQRTTFAPRVRELELMDVIEKCGKRRCGITKRKGYVFRMTGRRPRKRIRPAACPLCHGTGKMAESLAH